MITIVKGDDVVLGFVVKSDGKTLTSSDISHLYFSSNSLNLTKELQYNSIAQEFVLDFTKNETTAMETGIYSFDLTADSVLNDRTTITHNDTLGVEDKINKVVV